MQIVNASAGVRMHSAHMSESLSDTRGNIVCIRLYAFSDTLRRIDDATRWYAALAETDTHGRIRMNSIPYADASTRMQDAWAHSTRQEIRA